MANLLISGEEKSILVAGQALAVWGAYYLDERVPLEQLAPLTSRDIDFYNKRSASVTEYAAHVREYLQQQGLDMTIYTADMGDHTSNIAKWYLCEANSTEGIEVDFLDFLSGLSRDEIESNADEITIFDKSFLILSPVYCLKSRVNNLLKLYPQLGKSKDRLDNEEERVKLGIQIVRYHLQEMYYWGNDNQKRAMKRAMQVIKLARSSLGRQLWREKKISLLDAIPTNVFDGRFYEYTFSSVRTMYEQLSNKH